MPEPATDMKAVHARMDNRTRARGRAGRWWMNLWRTREAQTRDDRVINREELEAIYQRAEQKEPK